MENKKQKEILSHIWSLKERAEELRKEADNWEVKPDIGKKIEKINTRSEAIRRIIKMVSKEELTKKERKKLIRLTKSRLTALRKHFLSVHEILQKNHNRIWDKKIKITEKDLAEHLNIYEKIIPLLFRKKIEE